MSQNLNPDSQQEGGLECETEVRPGTHGGDVRERKNFRMEDEVVGLQKWLIERGHKEAGTRDGKPDGSFGNRTADALQAEITRVQRENGWEQNGRMDDKVREAIGRESPEAAKALQGLQDTKIDGQQALDRLYKPAAPAEGAVCVDRSPMSSNEDGGGAQYADQAPEQEERNAIGGPPLNQITDRNGINKEAPQNRTIPSIQSPGELSASPRTMTGPAQEGVQPRTFTGPAQEGQMYSTIPAMRDQVAKNDADVNQGQCFDEDTYDCVEQGGVKCDVDMRGHWDVAATGQTAAPPQIQPDVNFTVNTKPAQSFQTYSA